MWISKSARFKTLISYLPIVLSPFLLFSQTLITGRSLYWGTPALQFIPWRAFAWKSLTEGILPLWNPLNGMGAPLVANYQLALFYPPGWFVYLFAFLGGNPWMAWSHTLLVALHLAWAGIGMALLARRIGIGLLGQLVCGLAFSLSAYFVARAGFFSMIWAGSWLPWIILCASQIALPIKDDREPEPKKYVPFALLLCISLQFLSGHAQLTWYTLLLAFVWVFCGGYVNHALRGAIKASVRYGTTVLLAVLVTSIQLLPTFEYLRQSQRSSAVDYETTMTYSFWPWRFLTLLAPDLFGNPGLGNYWGYATFWEDAIYIGVLPVFMAISTAFLLIKKNGFNSITVKYKFIIIFSWSLIIIACVLALGKITPVFPFLYQYIPSFSMFQAPSRYMIWFIFAGCLLAGIGIENWHTPVGRGLYWFRLATAGAFAVTLGAFLAWYFLGGISGYFYPSDCFSRSLGSWGRAAYIMDAFEKSLNRFYLWNALVILWVAADLITAGWNLNPDVPSNFYSESNPANATIKLILGESRLYVSQADEYLLKFRRFFRFQDFKPIEPQENLAYVTLPDFNLIGNFSSANNFDPMLPARYVKWMRQLEDIPENKLMGWFELMNVGHIESLDISEPLGVNFKFLQTGRFYQPSCPIFVKTEAEAWNELNNHLNQRCGDTCIGEWGIIEDEVEKKADFCGENYIFNIDLTEDKSNHLSFNVNAYKPGWLILQDVWYPGWRARIDGEVVPIRYADYLFRGVYIPGGLHTLTFDYQPTWFYFGCILSGAGIIGLFIYYRLKRVQK